MAASEVVRQVDGRYEKVPEKVEEFLRSPPHEGLGFIFADWHMFNDDSNLRDLFCTKWAYPPMLSTNICRDANGYAASARMLQDDQKTVVDTSWFKFMIKHLESGVDAFRKRYDYHWYEMSFYICVVDGGASVAFCFNTPSVFQENLVKAVNAATGADPLGDHIALLQCLIIAEATKLYDASIWSLRDEIRNIEKRRSGVNHVDSALDFTQLHDLARHAIHACETTTVAVDTVTTLLGSRRASSCKCPGTASTLLNPNCPHNEMDFWLGMLQNLGRRAKSLNDRLSNEINLGFNLVVQRDSRETVEISRVTALTTSLAKHDSASMKTIAVVTLAFLPATFVCTIFSMSFFTLNIDGETGEKHWLISDRFWIYWVITIPLTVLTLICWSYGQRKEDESEKSRQVSWKSVGP